MSDPKGQAPDIPQVTSEYLGVISLLREDRQLVEQLRSAARQGNLFRTDKLIEAADRLEARLGAAEAAHAREAKLKDSVRRLCAQLDRWLDGHTAGCDCSGCLTREVARAALSECGGSA